MRVPTTRVRPTDSPFRHRFYVDRTWYRRGIGLALLNSVAAACQKLGYCQAMAAVGDSRNEGALKLHARAGYRTVGHAVRVE